jgi:hypothetical protein
MKEEELIIKLERIQIKVRGIKNYLPWEKGWLSIDDVDLIDMSIENTIETLKQKVKDAGTETISTEISAPATGS